MLSLHARLLLAASLVLAAFMVLTSLALEQAFRDSALAAVRERLQAQVYMLLGAAEYDPAADGLLLPQALPEARLSTPASGLYARVLDGGGDTVWGSESLLGLSLPPVEPPPPGRGRFGELRSLAGTPLLGLSFTVRWETRPGVYRDYIFQVAEDRLGFDAQVRGFRRSLWGWLATLAAVLLLAQGVILRWGLKPLRQVARELTDIEAARKQRLDGPYPRELARLTGNLNALLHQAQANLTRYRNALGDLAHSLKTPLAVLRGAVEEGAAAPGLPATVAEQVERMNRTVEYQLQRAAVGGRVSLASPLAVAPVAGKLAQALAKVYAGKGLDFEIRVEPAALFRGDEGDLLELLGNLMDNAGKWAAGRVRVSGRNRNPGLVLAVEDDGPGIPESRRRGLLERGARADSAVPGQGIGLAVVRELVEEVYQGRLEIGDSELGGARVEAYLRFD